MKFYKVRWRSGIRLEVSDSLPQNAEFPCIALVTDNWNDYGFETSYELNYFSQPAKPVFAKSVKILQREEDKTVIPESFEYLDERFCSLGQSIDYYKNIRELNTDISHQILTGLRDVVYNKKIANEFKGETGFSKSLLRSSEAEKAFREAGKLFPRMDVYFQGSNFKFQFQCNVQGANAPHILDFDFSEDKTELYRITAIIGKNGTGKTQVLANFATAMSGLDLGTGAVFEPERPSFSRVIAISYSVFDEFKRPPEEHKLFSYKYCGIKRLIKKSVTQAEMNQAEEQAEERLLNLQEIREKLSQVIREVRTANRSEQWIRILSQLLDKEIQIYDVWTSTGELNSIFYNQLSSGQRILVLVMTEVIAYIEPESIILFDEPEIHLHPNALSALSRAFHLLLEEFDSYAIIATHSPILLQEIPSKYVRVFQRQGNYPIVSPLGIESFGENLTIITDDVFETTEMRNNYREHFKKLSEFYSYEEILSFFDDQLGFNARTFLSSLYINKVIK